MDEVTQGLWIGDLASALNVEELRTHGIYSILSAMRGRLKIQEVCEHRFSLRPSLLYCYQTFIRHQVLLDDTEDADILQHLLPSIHFIEAELEKGRGVLVHCHAGVSKSDSVSCPHRFPTSQIGRSASVVAAYLMYSKRLDMEAALEMIRKVRPSIEPNEGFLRQLEIFQQAQYRISRRDKTTRLYYMERAYDEVMNGDGSFPENNMFAKYPSTPSDSTPNTPGYPRRRIRCKMCRQELATREHMLDHGQLGAATPAATTPAGSRRPSTSARGLQPSNSFRSNGGTSNGAPEPRPRRPSILGGLGDSLTMSSISNEPYGAGAVPLSRRPSSDKPLQNLSEVPQEKNSKSSSALESDDEEHNAAREITSADTVDISHEAAKLIGRRLSDAVLSPVGELMENPFEASGKSKHALGDNQIPQQTFEKTIATTFISPSELAAELMTNPKLAALRTTHPNSQNINMTPLHSVAKAPPPQSAPILVNPKCSGYFVEPVCCGPPV
ncbi:hypothetical protein C0992_001731 [Termitomyces sp. T32_za158]|nr:hypothetical protein C0992_001731 [Termitomyces sp. T32_za158]